MGKAQRMRNDLGNIRGQTARLARRLRHEEKSPTLQGEFMDRFPSSKICLIAVIGFALVCFCQNLTGQSDDTFPTQKVSDFDKAKPGYCWYNQLQLDRISQHISSDSTIIMIARLGDKDRKANLNKRRLHNIRAYLTDGVTEQFRRSEGSIIIAEGERTKGHGRIEFYLDGRLIDLLIPYPNNDIGVADCYAGIDGDPWCATARQRLFYPCKDYVKKRPPKTNFKKIK